MSVPRGVYRAMGRTELTWMNSSSSPSKQSTSQSSATARLAVSTGLSFSCAANAGSRMPCHSGGVSKLRVKMHRLPRNTKAPCKEPPSPVPSTCSPPLLKAMLLKLRPRTSPVTSNACHTFWKVSAYYVMVLYRGRLRMCAEITHCFVLGSISTSIKLRNSRLPSESTSSSQ